MEDVVGGQSVLGLAAGPSVCFIFVVRAGILRCIARPRLLQGGLFPGLPMYPSHSDLVLGIL
jgi:hypothetical protein